MTHKFSPKAALAITLLMGATLATGVHAQSRPDADPKSQMIADKFNAADTDHDGKLTLEEAKAGMPRVAKAFSRIDVEKKGYVTLEEIQAFVASH
jgi:Ca2+-binding EF-hand superfamily protein